MFNDDCMDHLSETGDKRLLLSYLNLKSLTKISLKEEFVHTKFTYFCGVVTYRLVDTSFNWLSGLFSGERLNQGQSMLQIVHSAGIVNKGEWLGSPANIKGANKDAKVCVGRFTTLHNLLFYAHTLCMNYVTNT